MAFPQTLNTPDPAAKDPRVLDSTNRAAGASPGVNIAPGSDDDGWVVPPPVQLSDGTTIQLFKDGEALHAAYEAIRRAKRRICLEVYIFASDDTGHAFADLLAAKARQGVRVFLIYDSFGSIDTDRNLFLNMRRAGVDIRAFVVNGKVVASMMRQSLDDDFRSNLHQGGEGVKVKLSLEERNTARKAAKAMGLQVCGVDMMRSERGPLVLEVNASPGFHIEKVTERNVASRVIDYAEVVAKSTRRKDKVGA